MCLFRLRYCAAPRSSTACERYEREPNGNPAVERIECGNAAYCATLPSIPTQPTREDGWICTTCLLFPENDPDMEDPHALSQMSGPTAGSLSKRRASVVSEASSKGPLPKRGKGAETPTKQRHTRHSETTTPSRSGKGPTAEAAGLRATNVPPAQSIGSLSAQLQQQASFADQPAATTASAGQGSESAPIFEVVQPAGGFMCVTCGTTWPEKLSSGHSRSVNLLLYVRLLSPGLREQRSHATW